MFKRHEGRNYYCINQPLVALFPEGEPEAG